ncbi:iron chelate uptake ABC transporter family permease subunit [Sphingomonas beigongshangi]|uniref:iron chelate uptake ABC transporter family permease subunit n=1 Tax=Sphingomonas beigongshangi TaxID=2782540 RepID=UPI00193B9CDE
MNRAGRILALVLLVAAAFALSLVAGKQWLPWDSPAASAIFVELRLPRAALGLLLGAMLGLSGAVLQGFLRNPLADPGVLGVSSSGALGAVFVILYVGASGLALFAAAMAGALVALLVLTALTWRGADAVAFILAGTVLSSLTGALTAFLIAIAPNPYAVAGVLDWLMGALTDRGLADLARAAPFLVASIVLLAFTGRALDALSLGEAAARSLGIRVDRLQWVVMVGTGVGVGAGVAATGVIGFVGLVVPHLLRPLFGHRPSDLLLPSALGGAALVLVADSLCRLAPGAAEVRLGVAMALIGAPFFLMLLLRRRGQAWI